MAREPEAERRVNSEPEVAPEAVAPEAAAAPAAETQFTTDGPIPEVAAPATAAAAADVATVAPEVAAAAPEAAAAATDVAASAGATAVEAAAQSASEQAFAGEPTAAVADPQKSEEVAELAQNEGATTNIKGDSYDIDRGVFDWRDYQKACTDCGTPERWRDEYAHGHTEAQQFVNPHEHGKSMEWQLKAGESASTAVAAWLDGPTIADTASTALARDINDLRFAIGDNLFDRLFGSSDQITDSAVPIHQRLHIKSGGSTLVASMRKIADQAQGAEASTGDGKLAAADLDNEDWLYFSNNDKATTAPPEAELTEDSIVGETTQEDRVAIASDYSTADATYADDYSDGHPREQVTVPDQVTVPVNVTVPAPEGFLASATEQIQTEDQKKARDNA